VRFESRKELFGQRAAEAPFIAYAFTSTGLTVRHYTVAADERLEDSWPLDAFERGRYHFWHSICGQERLRHRGPLPKTVRRASWPTQDTTAIAPGSLAPHPKAVRP
jgi:hypothetical protein